MAAGAWNQFNFSHQDIYRIELCLEELVTNMVSYSAPLYANQPVELHAVIEAQKVTFTLIDPAAPFDPFLRAAPTSVKSIEDFQIGGQGIHLVREFSNAFRYERSGDKNRVELVFDLEQPATSRPMPVAISRGIDRRGNLERPEFPIIFDGMPIAEDRRQTEDRRAMGFLSKVQIFRNVPYAAIEDLIGRMPLQEIVGETILLKRGDMNDAVRIVLQGNLKVYLDQPGTGDFIAVGAGVCVGEMSIIDNHPVSAYVVAEPGTRLLVIDAATFLDQLLGIPRVAQNLMSAMSERMRMSDKLTIKRMRKEMEMELAQRELQHARSIQEGLLPK
ncbi:MAG: ATP-binding protein [Gallionellaceae bacterium]